MSAYPQTKQDKALGRFLLISFVLHLLFLIFYPQWQVSPLPGTLPGEGAIQLTLRQAPEAESVALRPVTPQQLPPQPKPQPQPRPVEKPAEPAPVQTQPTPISPPVVSEVVAPVQPQVRPEPVQQAPPRETVAVEQVAPPRPQPEPRPIQQPVVESAPVVTSPTGTVPVVSQPEQSAAASVPDVGKAEASAPTQAAAEPAPPPPPPTVGSLFTVPGGQHIPKNLEDVETLRSTVSVRVIVTIDERGAIIRSEVDPTRSSDIPLANQYAILYAEQMVRNQPMPQGQAYQAAFVVTFNPNALDPRSGMVLSTEDNERIRFLGD